MFSIDDFSLPKGAARGGVVSFPPREKLISCRAQNRLPKEAVSVLIFSFPYFSPLLKGNISKYAMVADYHTVLISTLKDYCDLLSQKTGGEFVPFVDNSPIPEVYSAAKAGLGFLGANSLIIDPDYGSYVFLGTVVTNLPFSSTEGEIKRCIGCGRCQAACPGQAISNSCFEKGDCFSEITQKKRPPTQKQAEIMRKHKLLWGCDICQDVCPMNKNKKHTENPLFLEDIVTELTEEIIETCCKERAFGFRGTAVLYRNLDILSKHFI